MRATMQTIADATGADRGTVSRVLQGRGREFHIGRERERRILRAAKRLGYRPNAVGRALRAGRFYSVSLLLMSDSQNWLPEPLLNGIHDGLEAAGLSLHVTRLTNDQLTRLRPEPRALRQLAADGLLIAAKPRAEHAAFVHAVESHVLPAIWISAPRPTDALAVANRAGAAAATQHLLGLGHRRILFLGLPFAGDTGPEGEPDERYAGYAEAMHAAGAAPEKLYAGQDGRALEHNLRDQLLGQVRATAVLCQSARLGRLAVAVALQEGLAVPGQLSIMDMGPQLPDNEPLRLTRMGLDEYHRGRVAVELLQQKIETPNEPLPARELQLELQPGFSTAPASETR